MDLKFAVRSLMRQPMFALGAIATLALGIGANSTIFTFANAALFRPMPGISDPGSLVWISGVWRDRGREVGLSYPEYIDYRDSTSAQFESMFAFATPRSAWGAAANRSASMDSLSAEPTSPALVRSRPRDA